MSKKSAENFSALDENAEIFQILSTTKTAWWQEIINDRDLYIDIRKDNYINVYYYGGSLAKIFYSNKKLTARIHREYVEGGSLKINDKNNDKNYCSIEPEEFTRENIRGIKEKISQEYLNQSKKDKERPAEKWIQGYIIKQEKGYIDSEFQYNKDKEIGNLRIDLVRLIAGELTFIELKGITDPRLRNDKIRNQKTPEIVEQMSEYEKFIKKYSKELHCHYMKLLKIKKTIGLFEDSIDDLKINSKPKLLIANTYMKPLTKRRKDRIQDIESLLKEHEINYSIFSYNFDKIDTVE